MVSRESWENAEKLVLITMALYCGGAALKWREVLGYFFSGRGARFQVLLFHRQNISAETEETEKGPIRFLRVISLSRIREIPKSDASNTNLLLLLLLLPFRHPCNCKNSCYRDRAATERISSRRKKGDYD